MNVRFGDFRIDKDCCIGDLQRIMSIEVDGVEQIGGKPSSNIKTVNLEDFSFSIHLIQPMLQHPIGEILGELEKYSTCKKHKVYLWVVYVSGDINGY